MLALHVLNFCRAKWLHCAGRSTTPIQRLIVACNRSDDLQGLFRYELCSYPAALFDSSLTLRKSQKPVLADAIWAKLSYGS